MRQRVVVGAAASLEIIVGALFLTVPAVPCLLLFGARPESIGVPLGRFAGIALVALGIACLRQVVLGLFAFNLAAAVLFAWVGVAGVLHGLLLWPAVILHISIGVAL